MGLSCAFFEWKDLNVKENANDFEITVTVELVGYAKTKALSPRKGMTKEYYEQTVTITVSKESLAAYDATGAKTYIRDAGQYYFTAARDAHEATKNILAKKRPVHRWKRRDGQRLLSS